MIVNCINLSTRIDRRESAQRQADEQGFKIMFCDGVVENPAFKGISLAHRQIIKSAKEAGDTTCVIMEDDCVFSSPKSFDYYINNIPDDFDIYFSMIYSGTIKGQRIVSGISGLTLYMVHERFYDFFLTAPNDQHLDRWLGHYVDQFKFMVCDPYVCKQLGGFSDNHKRKMDYSEYEREMKFF